MRASLAPGRVLVLICILIPALLSTLQAAGSPLFDAPLHLTREVSDPISGTTSVLDEYCVGDRVISIRESRTSIADYAAGSLTEIDRANGTYSVTSFDAIARALTETASGASLKLANPDPTELSDHGVRSVGGRGGRAFEAAIEQSGASRKIEVVVDQQLLLSREAVEVLVGAAFPMRRSAESDLVLAAASRDHGTARSSVSPSRDHALPLEQTVTWNIEGETLRVTNRVLRVGNELPSPDLVAIPPGARLVESEIVLRKKMLDELDRLPSAGPAAQP